MKTPTHAVTGWLIARFFGLSPKNTRAVIAGASVPDLPVIAVGTVLCAVCHTNGRTDLFKPMMDAFYFGDTLLRDAHSFLHSPANLVLILVAAVLMSPFYQRLSEWSCHFVFGAVSHAFLDILTHVEDAPLLVWPFSKEVRWPGPVSHWDHRHFGEVVTAGEICLWFAFVVYFALAALNGGPGPVNHAVSFGERKPGRGRCRQGGSP